MLENYFIKGLIIGIVFGVPVGVVGVLSIQRGLILGPFAGFITGIGSSVADVFYAWIGVFGITVISDFLLRYQSTICLAGCLTVIAIGVRGFWRAGAEGILLQPPAGGGNLASCFFSSFTIAITNPATILSFMVVFSLFQIEGTQSLGTNILLVVGIFSGTCVWWLIIALAVGRFRNRITDGFYPKLNRIFGVLMVLLGGVIGVRMMMI